MFKVGTVDWWGNLVTYLLLSLTFGIIGIDRFYKGEVLWGVLKLISIGGFGVWYLIDIAVHAYRFGRTGQWTKGELTTD
jgi:TM2 domain-containing membrane protein YozV